MAPTPVTEFAYTPELDLSTTGKYATIDTLDITIKPPKGYVYQGFTGTGANREQYYYNKDKGYYYYPRTGQFQDKDTGNFVEPNTGYHIDPKTDEFINPATGKVVDASEVDAALFTNKKYRTADIVNKDSPLNEAAAAGDIKAKYDLAIAHLDGKAVRPNIHEAKRLLDEIATIKFPRNSLRSIVGKANYNLGELATEEKEKAKFYEKAAELNHPDACFALGKLYETGIDGAKPDPNKAMEYYLKAANLGHTIAQFNVAINYEKGIGVPAKYPDIAVDLYKRVIENPKSPKSLVGAATNNLAVCYEEGRGVEKNLKEAKKLYEQAAKAGVVAAAKNLKAIQTTEGKEALENNSPKKQYESGLEHKKLAVKNPVHEEQALALFESAAKSGHVKASAEFHKYLWELGSEYEDLAKMAPDNTANKEKSAKYFQVLVELGDIGAKFKMAQYYEKGFGVKSDYSKATKLYEEIREESADPASKSNAAYFLAKIYQEKGADISSGDQKANDKKAVEYLQAALKDHPANSSALFELAQCYENGKGIDKNENKAIELYKEAILNVGHKGAEEKLKGLQNKITARNAEAEYQTATKVAEAVKDVPAKATILRRSEGEVIDITTDAERAGQATLTTAFGHMNENYATPKITSPARAIDPVTKMINEARDKPAVWFGTSPAKKAEALCRKPDLRDSGVGADGLLELAGMYATGEAHTGFVSDKANAIRLYNEVSKSIYADTKQQQQAREALDNLKHPERKRVTQPETPVLDTVPSKANVKPALDIVQSRASSLSTVRLSIDSRSSNASSSSIASILSTASSQSIDSPVNTPRSGSATTAKGSGKQI